MTPLLLCAYRPKYLRVVLKWLFDNGVPNRYRIYAWDNGGAAEILREFKLEWHCVRDEATGEPVNVGKSLAMRNLVDVIDEQMPRTDCYVCMDDDIIVGLDQLDVMTEVARRPGMGMIAASFHPFNSYMPPSGSVVPIDPCLRCGETGKVGSMACPACRGSGKNPNGLQLRVYPAEDRTVHKVGRVAGGLFAVSRDAVRTLPWGPNLYPFVLSESNQPIVYWTEDAELDAALTAAGRVNGYLQGGSYVPAIHLPDLDPDYLRWKSEARIKPPSSSYHDDKK